MSADLLKRLIEAGTPAELVADIAMALAEKAADQRALERRREAESERARRYRDNGGGQVPGWLRRQIFERDGYRCVECDAEDRLEIDHVIPVSKGGSSEEENLQTLCKPCNARKRDRIRKSDSRGQTRTNADKDGLQRTGAEIMEIDGIHPAPNKRPLNPKINPTPCAFTGACEPAHEAAIPGHRLPQLLLVTVGAHVGAMVAYRVKALAALWNGTPPPANVNDEVWSGFITHRRAMPKAGKFTPRAYKLLCDKLEGLAKQGYDPNELLDTAIERNWITVFPPKEGPNPFKAAAVKLVAAGKGGKADAAATEAEKAAVAAIEQRKAAEPEQIRQIRRLVKMLVGPAEYDSWLRVTAIAEAGDELRVSATSSFKASWLDQHYSLPLHEAAQEVLGKDLRVRVGVVRPAASKAA